jgi:solute carrier family 35 protein C2
MISLYNKWMFSPDHFGFPYPLLVTTFHMFVQFTLASCLRYMLPSRFKPDRSPGRRDYMCVWRLYSPHDLPLTVLRKKVAPTGVMTAADIGLSNLSLKTVTLSFYSMFVSASPSCVSDDRQPWSRRRA